MWSTHSLVLYSGPEFGCIIKKKKKSFTKNVSIFISGWTVLLNVLNGPQWFLQLFITFFPSVLQYGNSVRDVWVGVTHSAQHYKQDDHQWRTHGKRKPASFTLTIPSSIYTGNFICLFSVICLGITRPADPDGGDAQDGAHIPAEHGPAAGRETGRLGGEQWTCLRPQTGRLWRLLQQRYMIYWC